MPPGRRLLELRGDLGRKMAVIVPAKAADVLHCPRRTCPTLMKKPLGLRYDGWLTRRNHLCAGDKVLLDLESCDRREKESAE